MGLAQQGLDVADEPAGKGSSPGAAGALAKRPSNASLASLSELPDPDDESKEAGSDGDDKDANAALQAEGKAAGRTPPTAAEIAHLRAKYRDWASKMGDPKAMSDW